MRFLIFLALCLLSSPVTANHHGHTEEHTASPASPATENAAPTNPAILGYLKANETMHKDMNIQFSGDADVDFVKGMIPHHQGAIDMAKVVLAHGKDSSIRALAESIIVAQEQEISAMRAWLAAKEYSRKNP